MIGLELNLYIPVTVTLHYGGGSLIIIIIIIIINMGNDTCFPHFNTVEIPWVPHCMTLHKISIKNNNINAAHLSYLNICHIVNLSIMCIDTTHTAII